MKISPIFAGLFILIPTVASAESMLPLPNERLPNPISLSDKCSNVNIVEWRGTKPSNKARNIIDNLCNDTVEGFNQFMQKQHIQPSKNLTLKFYISLSLIPADLDYDGAEHRNLNDLTFRFASRSKEYDQNGDVYPIWGYSLRQSHFIFVRNDVLTEKNEPSYPFQVVLAHELGHALSYHYGIYDQHGSNKDVKEENMIRRFTKFLGFQDI